MQTPIADFVQRYAESGTARFHMPAHKGAEILGCEARDITEISGADYLHAPEGIIAQSEANAAELFGTAATLYSTEGSSLCIRAMLALVCAQKKQRPFLLAARNAHRAFFSACVLCDAEVCWVYPQNSGGMPAFALGEWARALENCPKVPDAVYVTCPDYYGNFTDIAGLAALCHARGIPLLVDNAHGAYLKFLSPSRHPMDLGADLCCDSAHKTLPVLTGGAYLQIAKTAPPVFAARAQSMMALFASTSPSYLILQSLDLCNRILADDFGAKIADTAQRLEEIRRCFAAAGVSTAGEEPLKLTLLPRSAGYSGTEFARILRTFQMEPEMAEERAVVLMASPWNAPQDFAKLTDAAAYFQKERRTGLPDEEEILPEPLSCALTMREARFAPCERISVDQAAGRICAEELCSCQPSVPIAAPGEVLDAGTIKICRRYSIFTINVVK